MPNLLLYWMGLSSKEQPTMIAELKKETEWHYALDIKCFLYKGTSIITKYHSMWMVTETK